MFRTEYEFTLPCGFVDETGRLHRDGVMRLATALDELEAMRDPRVRAHESYLSVVLLSRVLVRLGSTPNPGPEVVERLFSADFAHLQDLFVRLNDGGAGLAETQCPECGAQFSIDLTPTASA
jgi:hypothetical protein